MRHLLPLLMLGACGKDDPPETGLPPPEERTVLVVILDGVPLDVSLGDEASSVDGSMPSTLMPRVWSELVPLGVRSLNAWNATATLTIPAHACLVAGRAQPMAEYAVDDDPGLYRPVLPSWWEALRGEVELEEGQANVVSNGPQLETLDWSLWPGGGEDRGASWVYAALEENAPLGDDGVALTVQTVFTNSQARSVLVNLHNADQIAHEATDADEFLHAVSIQDEAVADLWAAVQEDPTYRDNTWLILTADHGRHDRGDSEMPWRDHGDSCPGCRRIPLLILGPSVKAGFEPTDPILLQDLGVTAAALLGVSLPFSDGFVLEEIFDTLLGSSVRSGVGARATAGGHLAQVEYLPDRAHRSRLLLDGVEVSDPLALQVDAPVMASDGAGSWLCWREMVLSTTDASPWVPRCRAQRAGESTWTDIGGSTDSVSPFWEPVLVPDRQGGIFLVYSDSPGAGTSGVPLVLAHASGGAWTEVVSEAGPSFPTDLVAVHQGDVLVVAAGGGDDGDASRDTRDIWTWRVRDLDTGPTWGGAARTDLALAVDLTASARRLESPILRVSDDGSALELAAQALHDTESDAVLARSTDKGVTWNLGGTLALDRPLAPHVRPAWLDGEAVFAVEDTEGTSAGLCRGRPDTSTTCVDLGVPRVLRMYEEEGTLAVILDRGEGAWEVQVLSTADFGAGT